MFLAVAGCGHIGFAPHAVADGGGGPRDGASVDAACTWSPWSIPTVLPGPINSPADDWTPTPTRGGLELFFYSYRGGGADIYHATRASIADAFGAASAVTELSTTSEDRATTLSADALDIIFERDGQTGGVLYEATRASIADPFSNVHVIAELVSGTDVNDDPFLSADGLRLVFASSRRGSGTHGLDLFETTRPARDAPFAMPVELAALDSDVDDGSPTLSADGLEIFFASTRPGGPGASDVYTAHRPALDQPFGPPQLVPELSSAMDDVGLRLTPGGATMFMNYDDDGLGGGNADLSISTRGCP